MRISKRRVGLGAMTALAVMLLAIAPASADVTPAAPSVVHEFPSSDSTVVGSVGFIDEDEVGYFWSVARGDRVSETFTGPGAVDRAVLKLKVVTNVLNNDAHVDWDVEINGVVVGSFTVHERFQGRILVDVSFPPIPGPSYDVTIRVTNEVAEGEGSHTLAYAGPFVHGIKLIRRP